jgi:hypothetical protein
MKPNWPLLIYLVALGAAVSASILLSTVALAADIVAAAAGKTIGNLRAWVAALIVPALGLLPWPGLVILARALLRPVKPLTLTIENNPTGRATVALIALNEEQAITHVVAEFVTAPNVSGVVVVDNGSTDRTPELAAAAGARVVREERRGYGFACMRALREGMLAHSSTVVLCEADSTFRADDLEKMNTYLKHADLVIGSRTHPSLLSGDSQLNSFFVLGNVFVGKILQFRYWNWTMGGRLRLTDVGCTYMAVRADALERILPSLEVGGNHFVPHLLMVALEHGLHVVQIPITFWKRVGTSKGGNASWRKGFQLGLIMIWHILTYQVRQGAALHPVEELRHVVSRQ